MVSDFASKAAMQDALLFVVHNHVQTDAPGKLSVLLRDPAQCGVTVPRTGKRKCNGTRRCQLANLACNPTTQQPNNPTTPQPTTHNPTTQQPHMPCFALSKTGHSYQSKQGSALFCMLH